MAVGGKAGGRLPFPVVLSKQQVVAGWRGDWDRGRDLGGPGEADRSFNSGSHESGGVGFERVVHSDLWGPTHCSLSHRLHPTLPFSYLVTCTPKSQARPCW